MTSKALSYAAGFARWYFARVKEVPLVVASFALGGCYVAILMVSPGLLKLALALIAKRIGVAP